VFEEEKDMEHNLVRRVVVTGVGAVTPIGLTFTDFWNNALAGKSGVSNIESFDVSEYPSRIAGEVKDFRSEDFFEKKLSRRMDRFIQFAYAATLESLRDSRLDLESVDRDRAGIFIGSGIGGLKFIEEQKEIILKYGPKKVSPFLVPMTTIDMASGQISIYLGLRGPNFAVSSACATGNNAIGLAYEYIRSGQADVMFSGGTEAAIIPLCLSGFSAARALSIRNDDPQTASRPFDSDRDGFVVGEGGAVLLLEEYQHAVDRGAHMYAEILGFSATGDGYHLTAPHPEGYGAQMAMRNAIAQAGIEKEQVSYINAHGTSTGLGDVAEIRAIKSVFGDHAPNLNITATKSLIGHLLGGAGAVGAACAVKTVESGEMHPSINIFNQDPECDLNIITEHKHEKVPYALCNAFGFGGHNTCLLFGAVLQGG